MASSSSDFDDILDEIWGTGWYQKRLTIVLMGTVFFLMPFALIVQIFVLHQPGEIIK
jgi:TRAP-type mannitol/chloroaromatic compound transport system permease small subunit